MCAVFQGQNDRFSLAGGADARKPDDSWASGAGQTAHEAAQYGRGGFGVYTTVGFFGTATLLSETEPKPSKLLTQFEYDTYLDRLRLGGGKTLVNTRGKAIKQADSDKIAHDALQNFWKMAVADMNKRKSKNNVEAGANAEGSRERF